MATVEEPVADAELPADAASAADPAAPTGNPIAAFLDPRSWLTTSTGRTIPLIVALVGMWIVFDVQTGGVYLGSFNIANILVDTSLYGIVAIGVVVVLLLGEIDLSLGSLVNLCGCSAALIMIEWVPTWPAIPQMLVGVAASLVIGVICGAFQGFWVAVMKVPSFVVTLAGLLAFQGISLVITNTQTVTVTNDYFNAFGSSSISAFNHGYLPMLAGSKTSIIHFSAGILVGLVIGCGYTLYLLGNARSRKRAGLASRSGVLVLQGLALTIIGVGLADTLDRFQGVPLSVFCLIVLLIVFAYILRRTRFGRHIYATGGNAEAARRAGIAIQRVRWSAFIISGLMAGVVGVIFLARDNSINGTSVDPSFLLLCIASAVIGGTSLFGGRGSVWSALTGALILSSVQYGMNITMTASADAQYYQYIVEGGILLAAVWLDTYAKGRSSANRAT